MFIKHRSILQAINKVGPVSPVAPRAQQGGNNGVAQQIQLEVRAAYNSATPLRLQRHFEV